jgi:hypothetical protein
LTALGLQEYTGINSRFVSSGGCFHLASKKEGNMNTRVTGIAAAVLAPTIVLIVVLSLSSQAASLDVPPTVTRVTPTELSIINVRMFSISKANLKRRCTPRDEQVKSVFELPPT